MKNCSNCGNGAKGVRGLETIVFCRERDYEKIENPSFFDCDKHIEKLECERNNTHVLRFNRTNKGV